MVVYVSEDSEVKYPAIGVNDDLDPVNFGKTKMILTTHN